MAEEIQSLALVGHGPSMLDMEAGEAIDSHDYVVRFKRHSALTKYPKHFGRKTDAVVGSWTIAGDLKAYWPNVGRFFVFIDSRHPDVTPEQILTLKEHYAPKQITADKTLCDEWNETYRLMRGEEAGHDHVSAGCHALFYVGHYLRPKSVSLFGFDSLATGNWTWSLTRGPNWDQYPDHRFDIEKDLAAEVGKHYKMTIKAVFPQKGPST